ncbi:MAG: 30S ribosomal protein S6 [Candidatus Saccharimonadales bacterium]
MSARAKQPDAEQGAARVERKEDVRDSTSSEHRSQEGSNASGSTGGATSSAGGQASTVRSSVSQYEIAVLYHPDLEIDLEKATGKVEKIITESKGKIVKTDNWGKRKLAYPIVKQDFAVYVFYTVDIPPENVAKVEQTFNITDEIIRFLITKPDLKAIAKAEALRAEKAKKATERKDRDEDSLDEETPKPRRGSKIEE